MLQTFGKCRAKGDNTFGLLYCPDESICSVSKLESFAAFMSENGLGIAMGYIFRPVRDDSLVLDFRLCYETFRARLKFQYRCT